MGEAIEDEVLDTEQEQAEEVTEEQVDQTEATEGAEEAGGEEDVIQIGDEEPPASEEVKAAPAWVKDLRDRQKQLTRENAELRAKLGTGQPAPAVPRLPAKPKLADFEYDEEKFEQARDAWDAKKREVDSWEADQRTALDAQQKAVQAIHENYARSKAALKVKDFQAAEDAVQAEFSTVQQSILMAGASNPALLVAAIGSNAKKLSELASIKDPVKFAVAVGHLEKEVKVIKRTSSTKPAPDTTVRAGSGSPPATSATLERLRAEADRTGDRSKVSAYLRQQRAGK